VLSWITASYGPLVRVERAVPGLLAMLLFAFPSLLPGQTDSSERPVPILTGSAGFFASGNGGERESLWPIVMPVVLVASWRTLAGGRRGASSKGVREAAGSGSFHGPVEQELGLCRAGLHRELQSKRSRLADF